MKRGLVSIISPCYNKAASLERFIKSVIHQDYRPIELIVVDDGSTDNSKEILDQLEAGCSEAGIITKFSTQDNKGVGAAINTCLKQVSGEYLCWPDCDDWLDKFSISKRVDFLNRNRKYAIVTSNADIYKENDLKNPIGLVSTEKKKCQKEDQFELLLNGESIVCPGCHMVRSDAMFSSMGGNQIYPSRYGQNLQLLYPILYHNLRGFIDEPLYHYVIYNDSLSHYKQRFEDEWKHREGRYQIKLETINRIVGMGEEERKKYTRIVSIHEARYRLKLAKKYLLPDIAKEQVAWLRRLQALSVNDMMDCLYVSTKKALTD